MELIGIDLGVAAFVAVVTYLVCRRDLGAARAAVVAVLSATVVGLTWFLALYLAVAAFLAAVAVYALLRRSLPLARALTAATGTFLVLALAAVGVISLSLDTM